MVKISIRGIDASISDGVWKSEDAVLEQVLNSLLDPFGPSGSDPDSDYHAAEAAIKTLGGKILQADAQEYIDGQVY